MKPLKRIPFDKYAAGTIYAVMALVLMAKQCVLLKSYSLSLWPDMSYYLTYGLRPGVILPILGSMLTAFCKFPPLGATLILALLLATSRVIRKVIGNTLWAHLPSICMFLFLSGLDYSLYIMRSPGIIFSQILGLLFCACMVWGDEAIRERDTIVRIIYAALVSIIGYPLVGAYSIVAQTVMLLKASVRHKWGYAVFCLISGAVIPIVYTHAVFTHIDTHYTFLSGFPYMDFLHNYGKVVPLGLCILTFILLPLISGFVRHISDSIVFKSVFTAVAVAALVLFTYKDRNFHIELCMEQALVRNKWNKALSLASRTDKPTRVIIMYRNIALMRKGALCDKMFTYSYDSQPLDTKSDFVSQTMVSAMPVFFYNGLLNFSARWAFEESMIWQRNIERFKYLAKVALLSGYDQRSLVEKYLNIIAENPFEKKWVAQYREYLEDPSKLKENMDYRYSKLLSEYDGMKFASSAIVENSLIAHYLSQSHPHGVMLQLCLAHAMTVKDIDLFWYYFDILHDDGVSIPVHVGEAALLFASMSRNQKMMDVVVSRLGGPGSPIVQRFASFDRDASKARNSDQEKEHFRQRYGKTYWYYCFFTKEAITD